jgi:hypothetical protein
LAWTAPIVLLISNFGEPNKARLTGTSFGLRDVRRYRFGRNAGRSGWNDGERVEPNTVLVLAALLVALATPPPAPAPAPTNPFNLNPVPASSALPIIGTTRSRALCSAMRRVVAPAVVAAMTNDKTYDGFRKSLWDYTVNGTETSRDLKLMRMDRTVQSMVKTVDDLETALNSHSFDSPAGAATQDAQALASMRQSLRGVLDAQKVQLDVMSGFVETERMSRFGRLSESEASLARATGPDQGNSGSRPNPLASESPNFAFLRDSSQVFKAPTGKISLDDAHNLDRDLGDIAALTAKREDVASKVIIPATQLCK